MNQFFNDKKFELIFESYFRKTHAKFPFIKDDDINKKYLKIIMVCMIIHL